LDWSGFSQHWGLIAAADEVPSGGANFGCRHLLNSGWDNVFQDARRRDFSLAKEEARGAATGLLLPYFASGWGNARG
jgi:hypothetical protein